MARNVKGPQLEKDITGILKDADLSKLSSKTVRKSLEDLYKTDLTDRKKEIDSIVMKVVELLSSKSNDASDEDVPKKTDSEKKKATKTSTKKPTKNATEKSTKKPNSSNGSHSDICESRNYHSKDGDKRSNDSSSESDELEDSTPVTKKVKHSKVKTKLDDEELARQLQEEEEDGSRRKTRGGGRKCVPARKGRKSSGDGEGGSTKRKTMFTQLCVLSAPLAEVMGEEKMARSEVVKRMWAISKERQLLDPKNKQFMICDKELQTLFQRKRIRMFGMMKYLTRHIFNPDDLITDDPDLITDDPDLSS